MSRNFEEWLDTFKDNISTFDFYVDFNKVYSNVEKIKVELNILNSLIGSPDIENEFLSIVERYPETLKCIPILLAVRSREIPISENNTYKKYKFNKKLMFPEEYAYFMKQTGLFDLIGNKKISNLFDYVTGVEVGLDTNARKNRGGHLMEALVEQHLKKFGLVKNVDYFKEMYVHEIESKWGVDLSSITNNHKTLKRLDFVVKTQDNIYGIETNFYSSGGSKLNETSRSYKNIALESKNIEGFKFVWITDGLGWRTAKNNLRETFENMDDLYNINDMNNNIFKEIFI